MGLGGWSESVVVGGLSTRLVDRHGPSPLCFGLFVYKYLPNLYIYQL